MAQVIIKVPPQMFRPSATRTTEYDAFEALTSKLVQVPKSEVDAQRKK